MYVLAVAAACLAVFSPMLNNGTTNYDDCIYITGNTLIRSLSPDNLKAIFGSHFYYIYHPLTVFSYSLEYALFGLKPEAYHITNTVLHLANCLLLFYLVLLLGKNAPAAFIAALVFCVHPLHVEPVAWISGRKDVLSAFFLLSSLVFYVRYQNSGFLNAYLLSLGAFLLALLSKPTVLMLPFILLYHNIYVRKTSPRETTPFFLLSAAAALISFLALPAGDFRAQKFISALPGGFLNACYGILFYLAKLSLPLKLSVFYPPVEPGGAGRYIYMLSPFVVILIFGAVIYSLKYTKKIFRGLMFFTVMILPVLQLVRLSSESLFADRYTYIPSIGLICLVSDYAVNIYGRLRRKLLPAAIAAISLSVIICLAALSFKRCLLWKNDAALWNDVIVKYGDVPLAYNNRALAYLSNGQIKKAHDDLSKAVKLSPGYTRAYVNRSGLYIIVKEYDRAINDANLALKSDPSGVKAYYNRASAYYSKGDPGSALGDLEKALNLKPDYPEAYALRGRIRLGRKNYTEALADFSRALALDPGSAEALENRAALYFTLKDYRSAIGDLSGAMRSGAKTAGLYYSRGNAYNFIGQYDRAIADYGSAIAVKPDYLDAYYNRAATYLAKRDFESAEKDIGVLKKKNYKIPAEFLKDLNER